MGVVDCILYHLSVMNFFVSFIENSSTILLIQEENIWYIFIRLHSLVWEIQNLNWKLTLSLKTNSNHPYKLGTLLINKKFDLSLLYDNFIN